MKSSARILIVLLTSFFIALIFSNFILRNEFRKIDKRDAYWNYNRILEERFHHVRIEGNHTGQNAIEQSDFYSVKEFKHLKDFSQIHVTTSVINDTLVVIISPEFRNAETDRKLFNLVLFRILTPGLQSVSGTNVHLTMAKMKQ